MHSSATRWSIVGGVLAALVAGLWSGGGTFLARHARLSYDAEALEIARTSWDSLRVQPRFTRRTSLSSRRVIAPETTFVHIFSAGYDTLYSGPAGGVIPLPDYRLASREPVLVEACGVFRRAGSASRQPPRRTSGPASRTLCQQTTVFASPKRVQVAEAEITYPQGPDFQQGQYDVRFLTERRAFEDTTWETLSKAVPLSGYLRARSESAGGEASVRVPMSASGRGTFDLSRYDGYDDFQYHLRSAMQRAGALREGEALPSATVAFDVLAGLGDASPQPVTSIRKEVRRLTPAERRRRVRLLAQSAAAAIAQRVLPDDWEEARAAVQGWRYDRLEGRYEVDVRIRWYERDDFGDRYTVEGTLQIDARSRRTRFIGERGNRRAIRRWRRTVEGDELQLGILEEPTEEGGETTLGEPAPGDLVERSSTRRRGRHAHRHQ